MEQKIKNIEGLRDVLLENFDKLVSGELKLDEAKEISNMAGKVINTCKVQVQYNEMRKIDKSIVFLEV